MNEKVKKKFLEKKFMKKKLSASKVHKLRFILLKVLMIN